MRCDYNCRFCGASEECGPKEHHIVICKNVKYMVDGYHLIAQSYEELGNRAKDEAGRCPELEFFVHAPLWMIEAKQESMGRDVKIFTELIPHRKRRIRMKGFSPDEGDSILSPYTSMRGKGLAEKTGLNARDLHHDEFMLRYTPHTWKDNSKACKQWGRHKPPHKETAYVKYFVTEVMESI